MTAASYNFLHTYLDEPDSKGFPPSSSGLESTSYSSESILEILGKVALDERLDGIFEHKGNQNISTLFNKHEDVILEHWNAWKISEPTKQFQESQRAAAILLTCAEKKAEELDDFFLVHLLTTSHAVRIILPSVPAQHHLSLLRQWWLLTLAVYIAQLRPQLDERIVMDYNTAGKDWHWIVSQAIGGNICPDPHYIKALRALKEAAHTWGDDDHFYIKAAVKFVDNFSGWGGFE